jgi:hypothetical protein
VDLVPVANQRENEQHKRDQQQPGSFRGVDRVAVMLVIVLGSTIRHASIVALGAMQGWVLGCSKCNLLGGEGF